MNTIYKVIIIIIILMNIKIKIITIKPDWWKSKS